MRGAAKGPAVVLAAAAAVVAIGCRAGGGPSEPRTVAESRPSGRATDPGSRSEGEPPPAGAAATSSGDGGEALRIGEGRVLGEVGGAQLGFLWWASANGRLLAIYRFPREPSFGHHGSPDVRPQLTLFDLEANTSEVYDELVATSPTGKHAVVRRADGLWLVSASSGSRTDLVALGASTEGDRNRCLPPRQASFGARGRHLAWIDADSGNAVVLDLQTRRTREVTSGPGRLWRVLPAGLPGWTVLREVPSDTNGSGGLDLPVQRTSCACRWCNRFALSYSTYGWSGDEFQSFLVGPDGQRREIESVTVPLGEGYAALPRRGRIVTPDGSVFPLPNGCTVEQVVRGARSVVLQCGDEHRLLRPADGEVVRLEGKIERVAETAVPGAPAGAEADAASGTASWVALAVTRDGRTHLGRLAVDGGALQAGPVAESFATRTGSRWAIGHTAAGLAVLDVATGEARTFRVGGVAAVEPLVAVLRDGDRLLVDPETGHAARLDGEPIATTAGGCAVRARSERRGLERGPWRVVCSN